MGQVGLAFFFFFFQWKLPFVLRAPWVTVLSVHNTHNTRRTRSTRLRSDFTVSSRTELPRISHAHKKKETVGFSHTTEMLAEPQTAAVIPAPDGLTGSAGLN